MKLLQIEDGWSIGLERKVEAQALLAAQATAVGNRVLSTTNPVYDRVTLGMKAIELLRFAELILPDGVADAESVDLEVVEFPMQESQHLSGLLYGATHDARITGVPMTEYDEQLRQMEGQVESFFGMA